jgi:hypothetical protein
MVFKESLGTLYLYFPWTAYMASQPAHNLTGQVDRIECWSFASGGSLELYKGKYLGRTMSISAYFTIFA